MLEQDSWERKPGQDSPDRTDRECRDGKGRTSKRGQDGQNMTEGQGSWDRTTEIGQPWQYSHDSKVGAHIWDMTSAMTLDRITQTAGTRQPGQESQDRRTGTGKSERQTG
jgi:hypothetical protein